MMHGQKNIKVTKCCFLVCKSSVTNTTTTPSFDFMSGSTKECRVFL